MNSISDIQKMFIERLKFFASQNEVAVTDIKIQILCDEKKDETEQVQFLEFVKGQFKRYLRIKEDILNLKNFDFLAKQFKLNFAIGAIANALMERLRKKHGGCTKFQVRMVIFVRKPEQEVPYIQVYKDGDLTGGEYITWEELEEIF